MDGRSEGIGGLALFCLLHSSQAHSGSYQQAFNACYSKGHYCQPFSE